MKISALRQGLLRKGLITEEDELTIPGKDILAFLETKGSNKFVKKKPASEDFLKWYNTYPATDTFTYKGKTFNGTRKLWADKHSCRLKFDAILMEGRFTADQMIAALELEIRQRKEASLKEGSNQLKYMINSLSYLNQNSHEAFIRLIEEQQDESDDFLGSTNI